MESSLPLLSRSLLDDLLAQQTSGVELPPRSLLTAPETILQFGSGKFLRGFVEDFVQLANAAGSWRQRVQGTGRGTQMSAGKVEVNRRLFQIAVTERQLDGAQVRSRFEQVCGKTMSQSVRVNPFFQAGALGGRRTGVPDGGGDDGLCDV